MSTSPWFMRFAPRPAARARLFCFSYAGGGAAVYRPFALALPQEIEVLAVQLPGRESRLRETPLRSMAALVDALVPQFATLLDRPYAFFGHSMGALTAFEVARALPARGHPGAAQLMVSGRRAPQLPETEPALHHLPDDAFVTEIDRRYGGIPAEILQHRDILELLLPALRADMTAIETHRHVPGPLLPCPITAFGGTEDRRAGAEMLAPWREQTSAGGRLVQFPGAHFYFGDAAVRERLIAEVGTVLAPLRAAHAGAAAG